MDNVIKLEKKQHGAMCVLLCDISETQTTILAVENYTNELIMVRLQGDVRKVIGDQVSENGLYDSEKILEHYESYHDKSDDPWEILHLNCSIDDETIDMILDEE
jgi:hypothetical protein